MKNCFRGRKPRINNSQMCDKCEPQRKKEEIRNRGKCPNRQREIRGMIYDLPPALFPSTVASRVLEICWFVFFIQKLKQPPKICDCDHVATVFQPLLVIILISFIVINFCFHLWINYTFLRCLSVMMWLILWLIAGQTGRIRNTSF